MPVYLGRDRIQMGARIAGRDMRRNWLNGAAEMNACLPTGFPDRTIGRAGICDGGAVFRIAVFALCLVRTLDIRHSWLQILQFACPWVSGSKNPLVLLFWQQ